MRRPAPICLTLLLCDQVVRDASGRKASLLDTFHFWDDSTFPTVIPRCAVWIELTDGEVLLESGFTLAFTDPRAIHSHRLAIVGLELPEWGEYRLSLIAFGLPLFERRLVVLRRGDQGA